jgi:hypothetical protein
MIREAFARTIALGGNWIGKWSGDPRGKLQSGRENKKGAIALQQKCAGEALKRESLATRQKMTARPR